MSLRLEWQKVRSNVGGREHSASFAIPALCRLQNLARANSDAAECPVLVQSAPLVDNVDRDAPFSVQSHIKLLFQNSLKVILFFSLINVN